MWACPQVVLRPSSQVRCLKLWTELYLYSPLTPYTHPQPTLHPSQPLPLATPTKEKPNGHLPVKSNGLIISQSLHVEREEEEEEEEVFKSVATSINNGDKPREEEKREKSDKEKLNGHNNDDETNTRDQENEASETGIENSQILWQSLNLSSPSPSSSDRNTVDMEESFRVVTETADPSLTTLAVREATSGYLTFPLATTPTDRSWLSHSLNYSIFSECESRLRLLEGDGLVKQVDPVQERVAELEGLLRQRVRLLEEEVKRLKLALTTGEGLEGVVKEETSSVVNDEKNEEVLVKIHFKDCKLLSLSPLLFFFLSLYSPLVH